MTPSVDASSFDAAVASVGHIVDRGIQDELDRGGLTEPDLRDAAFLYVGRGGKRLRPLLVFLAAGAVGGDPASARSVALAVEFFHTWTLIHDDVIDRDALRRGGPTVHVAFADRAPVRAPDAGRHYGQAVAILSGDYLQGVSVRLVLDAVRDGVGLDTVHAAAVWMQESLVRDLVEGEIRDVQLAHQPIAAVRDADLIEMYRQKSASLMAYSAGCGALVGLRTADRAHPLVAALVGFAERCGIAFQIRDDVLGLTADERKLGKPVHSDLREGKRTLILTHAYRQASEGERAFLDAVVGSADASPQQLADATKILQDRGGFEYAERTAEEYLVEARGLLDALPAGDHRARLADWAERVVKRDV